MDVINHDPGKLDLSGRLYVTKDMSKVKFKTQVESIPKKNTSKVEFDVEDENGETLHVTGRMDEIIRYNAGIQKSCTYDGTIVTPGSYDPELGDAIESTINE